MQRKGETHARQYLKQEPSALAVHAGICTGGVPSNRHSYRKPLLILSCIFPICLLIFLSYFLSLETLRNMLLTVLYVSPYYLH